MSYTSPPTAIPGRGRLSARVRAAAGGILLIVGAAHDVSAQDLSRYRDFQLGASVADVGARAEVAQPAIRTVHDDPALIQEWEWRPSHFARGSTPDTDPVDQITFRFYDDQLFEMVVAYRQQQTEGLTNADMIGALASVYGPPHPSRRAVSGTQDVGTVLAVWTSAARAVELYRGSDALRVVLISRDLHAAARAAAAQAILHEERTAPAREAAQRKQDAADERAARDRTREANKAAFQP